MPSASVFSVFPPISRGFLRAALLLLCVLPFVSVAMHAQGTAPALALGTVNVGSSISGTVTFTFSASTTVSAINVVTQGAPNLDFTLNSAAPGTCTTTTYAANSTCTVGVTLTPLYPGRRLGAVILGPATAPVATGYIYGIGNGGLVLAQNGTLATTFSTALNVGRGVAVDGNGNVFVNEQSSSKVDKFSPTGTLTTLATGIVQPSGGVVDGAGNYFIDLTNNIDEFVGGAAGTPVSIPSLNFDDCLVVDGAGNIYATVYAGGSGQGEIVEIAATTHTVTQLFAGGAGMRFVGMGIDAAGNLYPADFNNSVLYELPVGATTLTTLVTGNSLANPDEVALDAAGNIYVGNNSGPALLLRYAASTYALTTLTTPGQGALAIGPDGTLYTVPSNSTLQSYTRLRPTYTVSGVTAVGSASAAQTTLVEDDGNLDTSLIGVNVQAPAGLGSGETCAGSSALTVAGTNCTLAIDFAPTTDGASPQTGTVTFSSANAVPFIATITGDVTGDPTQLAFTPAPTTPVVAGGNAGTITVTLEDSTGATAVSGNTLPVTLTVTYPSSSQVVYGPTNAVNGIATFNTAGAALTVTGTYTYKATSPGLTSGTATETVTGGPASQLTLVAAASPAFVGAPDNITVTALDRYGNLAQTPANTDTIALTTTDATATLPGSFALANSSASKPITFNATGNFTVTATDTSNAAITSATINITVNPLPAYVVTSNLDDGGGACTNQAATGATPDAQCELRAAVVAVNAAGYTGTTAAQPAVTFASSLYGTTIKLTHGVIGFSRNIDLAGPGPANTITINGNGGSIMTAASAGTGVTLSGLSFTSSSGYGFLVNAALTIHFTNDIYFSFVDAGSGAIQGSALILDGSPTVTINGCTFSNNKISSTASTAYGGAVFQSGGTLTLLNSLFSGNSSSAVSTSEGGALYFTGSTATITGSTFTGNVVTGAVGRTHYGGAVVAVGTVNLYNDTITGNLSTDTSNSANIGNQAGGYQNGGGTATAYNTVISGNYAYSVSATADRDEYNITVTAGNGNYINTGASSACTTNCTPLLSTLGNYGGATQTMLPMPGSPLLAGGVISVDNGATTDGRGTGYSRTTAYNGTTHIDIGAVEANYTLGFVQQPTNTVVSQSITPAPTVQLYESGVIVAPNKISTAPTLSAGQTTANFPATGTGGPLAITASEGTLAGTTTQNTSTTNTNPGLATFSGLSINTLETDDTLTSTVQNSGGTVLASTMSDFFNVIDNAATLNYILPPDPAVATGNTACNSTVGAAASCTVTVGLYAAGSTTVDTTSSATVILTVSATGYTTQIYTVSAMNGVATFNLGAAGLSPSGTYTYSATAPTYTTDTASATEVVGAPGTTIASFAVAGVPSTVPAGVGYSFTVTAINSSGTTDTAFTGPVFLTSSDPAATFLPQNYTYNASDNGVHTFNVTFNTSGLQSITATTNGGYTGSETNIRVIVSYIWLANTTGTVDKLNDSGTAVLGGAVGTAGPASTAGGVAFDKTGNVWSVTTGSNALDFVTKNGTGSATYSGGGLAAPSSVLVDGAGYIWIANSGNATVSEFKNSGAAVSTSLGYGAASIGTAPSAVLIDSSGGVWVASKTGNSVTHLLGAATPVTTPTAAAVTNATVGVAP